MSISTMAHIGITIVLDAMGQNNGYRAKLNVLYDRIGEQIEDQAFIAYMEEEKPTVFQAAPEVLPTLTQFAGMTKRFLG